MSILIPATGLEKGDHFVWNSFPYEVVDAREGRHGMYVLAMRLQPEAIRIPDNLELEIERKDQVARLLPDD